MTTFYSGSLYQEIVRQNTGEKLPFIIAACTKEKNPQFALLQIPQDELDTKLEFLKGYLPYMNDIKTGKILAKSCGKCPYCIAHKKCEQIYWYQDFFNKED